MGRVVIAGIVAAVVVFVWGFLAWSVLMLYDGGVRSLPNDVVASDEIGGLVGETGAYFFPAYPEVEGVSEEEAAASMEAWSERHRRGPLGMVLYRAEGAEPMAPAVFLRGFGIDLLGGWLLAGLLAGATWWRRSLGRRVLFALLPAIFAPLVTWGVTWNWFFLPDDFALAMATDAAVGWFLGGLAVALIVGSGRGAGEAREA